MENKLDKTQFQGPGWDHFRGRDLHRKKLDKVNNFSEQLKTEDKEKKNVFTWIIDTVNPLNHLPIISSVKNLITKSNKSLDIMQSAVGGFLFAGPLGILKGIGGWAANKIANGFIPLNSDEVTENKSLGSNSNKLDEQVNNIEIKKQTISFNKDGVNEIKENDPTLNSRHYTNLNINSFEIKKTSLQTNQVLKNYTEIKNQKNKINISA